MARNRTIKQGDTWPALTAQLWEQENGLPLDLTEADAVHVWLRSETKAILTDPCEIIDAANGKVRYQFTAAETAEVGVYRVEWEVHFTPGVDGKARTRTVPNDDYLTLTIVEALDPTPEELNA